MNSEQNEIVEKLIGEQGKSSAPIHGIEDLRAVKNDATALGKKFKKGDPLSPTQHAAVKCLIERDWNGLNDALGANGVAQNWHALQSILKAVRKEDPEYFKEMPEISYNLGIFRKSLTDVDKASAQSSPKLEPKIEPKIPAEKEQPRQDDKPSDDKPSDNKTSAQSSPKLEPLAQSSPKLEPLDDDHAKLKKELSKELDDVKEKVDDVKSDHLKKELKDVTNELADKAIDKIDEDNKKADEKHNTNLLKHAVDGLKEGIDKAAEDSKKADDEHDTVLLEKSLKYFQKLMRALNNIRERSQRIYANGDINDLQDWFSRLTLILKTVHFKKGPYISKALSEIEKFIEDEEKYGRTYQEYHEKIANAKTLEEVRKLRRRIKGRDTVTDSTIRTIDEEGIGKLLAFAKTRANELKTDADHALTSRLKATENALRHACGEIVKSGIKDPKEVIKILGVILNKGSTNVEGKDKLKEKFNPANEYGFKKSELTDYTKRKVTGMLQRVIREIIPDFDIAVTYDSRNTLRVESRTKNRVDYKGKKGQAFSKVADEASFFSYDMNEVFKLIENFIREHISDRYRLSQEAKINLGQVVSNETKLLSHPVHGVEAEVNGKFINSLCKDIEDYINTRMNKQNIMKAPISADEKLKYLKKFRMSSSSKMKLEELLIRDLQQQGF